MASNALAYNDAAFAPWGTWGGVNRLAPDLLPQTAPTAYGPALDASVTYPSWLTDLSARGLATDWAAEAHVTPQALQFTPRDIPPDAPQVAPVQRQDDAAQAPPPPPWVPEPQAGGPSEADLLAAETAKIFARVPVNGGMEGGGSDGNGGEGGDADNAEGNGSGPDSPDNPEATGAPDPDQSGPADNTGDDSAESNADSPNSADNPDASEGAPDSGQSGPADNSGADNEGAGADGNGGEGSGGAGNGGESGGGGAGEGGEGGGGEGNYKGGLITRNKLLGPDPAGPDDGYASLNAGEGVITAAAMKHYGPGLLRKLNKLAIPKVALKNAAAR